MITRTQSNLLSAVVTTEFQLQPPVKAPGSVIPSPSISKCWFREDDDEQRVLLHKIFLEQFKVKARSLQIEAALTLSRKRDTFLLASTGYGKSRIPELFCSMFPKVSKPMVLILNPLDALGDNQVTTHLELQMIYFNPAHSATDSRLITG